MAEINKPTVTAAVPSYSLRLRSRDMSVANPDSETSTSSHLMHLAEHRGRRTRNPRVFTPTAPRNPSGFTARYRAHRCPPNWNSQLRALSRPLTQPQHDSKLLPHRDWRLQLRLTGHTRPPAVPVRARTHGLESRQWPWGSAGQIWGLPADGMHHNNDPRRSLGACCCIPHLYLSPACRPARMHDEPETAMM